MPIDDGVSLNGLFTAPLVLPVTAAAVLAALFLIVVLLLFREDGRRSFLSIVFFGAAVMAFAALFYQLTADRLAMERRAFIARNMALTVNALVSDPALACLDAIAGEVIENACEKAIFADPQSTARAVAYTAARLALLREAVEFAHKTSDPDLLDAFASTSRMVALDRYGLVAQVLSVRDRCSAERCYAFALVQDASVLQTNLKNQVFERYVSRYSEHWSKAAGVDQQSVVSHPPAAPIATGANAIEAPRPSGRTVDSRWDFPSAASIPPVDIMTGEQPSPIEPGIDQVTSPLSHTNTPSVPLPVARPQTEAATPTPSAR